MAVLLAGPSAPSTSRADTPGSSLTRFGAGVDTADSIHDSGDDPPPSPSPSSAAAAADCSRARTGVLAVDVGDSGGVNGGVVNAYGNAAAAASPAADDNDDIAVAVVNVSVRMCCIASVVGGSEVGNG